MGSDLLKFEETVTMHESDTFSFRTPKVPLLVSRAGGWALPLGLEPSQGLIPPALCLVVSNHLSLCPNTEDSERQQSSDPCSENTSCLKVTQKVHTGPTSELELCP